MLKVVLLPLLALAGGVGGFFLRRWELSSSFEPNGLAIPWTTATVTLAVLSIVVAAVFLLLLFQGSKNELTGYGSAFSAPNNWGYLVLTAVSSACLLVAGIFGIQEQLLSAAPKALDLLLWIMCLPSFGCVLATILTNFRAKDLSYSLVLLVPAYTCCLWLVSAYLRRASDPVILDYVYELFAIICILMSFYFSAGFSFGRVRFWPCAMSCLLSVYFGIITLADSHEQCARLLLLFSILYQLATVTVLLYNAFAVKPRHLLSNGGQTQEVTQDE